MAECSAVGITPLEFWDLTYREVFAVLAGAAISRRRDRQLAIFTAWHTEAFARQKRLPDLNELIRKMEPSRVMSPRAVRDAIIGAARAMGSVVTYIKKGER